MDMGCGMGGSFPYLVRAVGATGQVVGVEISPDMCLHARSRIAKHQWSNVEVIEASAQDVRLAGTFDAVLMFAVPDIYASEEALENIFPHLADNARVVAFGAKKVRHGWGKGLYPMLRLVICKLSFPTTPIPDEQPWRLLAKRLEKVDAKEYFGGLMFLISGSAVRM